MYGGIVDRNAEGWFVVPEMEGIGVLEGYPTQTAAIDALADAVAAKQAEQPAASVSDYIITDADQLGTGGAKTKYRDNVAAIRILRQLEEEERAATQEEQAKLVRYVGWGGLPQAFDMRNTDWEKEYKELAALLPQAEYEAARRSTQDAHYTSQTIIQGMYQAVERLGFAQGRILEPASGIGHFIGLQPAHIREQSSVTAIELDPTTAAIAKALYPHSTVINRGFQEVAVPSNMFDLAIGNPPFGNQKLYDPRHKDLSDFTIHNYFIAKSLDAVRPGGVVAVVVSNFFMDAGVSPAREHIAERANLIGAIRLPNNAFKQNAMTEVTTDIVFLQKLHEGQTPDRRWVDVGTVKDAATDGDIPLNQYFIDHPEMMLGRMALEGTMYAGGAPALVAEPGTDLAAELQRAIATLPVGIYQAAEQQAVDARPAEDTEKFEVPADVKIGAFFLSPKGRIAIREDDLLDTPQYRWAEPKNDKVAERIKGMIEIRTALRSLMAAERSESYSETEIESRRTKLNRVYDGFVKQHGFISSQTNKQAFVEDPEYALLHSLERDYDRGISKEVARKNNVEPREPSAKKAEIFSQRVMTPHREITSVETAKDALVVSMNETGKVDMELMVRLSGKPEDDLVRELSGLIYLTPQGKWETADRYLSGNVKQKLAEAVSAQKSDSRYTSNVEALQRVQPADIEPVDISIQLGSTWVPEAVVNDFVTHLLGDVRRSVAYAPSLGKWVANIGPSADRTTMRATWGTEDIPANELLNSILNGKAIQVKEVIGRSENGQPEYRIDEERTAAANQKADEIRQAFGDWVWEDKTRRETLARIYNDRFNTNVPPRYDGSHLVLPGSSKAITLRPHQKDAIWRGIQEGTALFDHVVGAGKTMVVIGTMMESRRMGLIKKPMIVVPNHLLMQWKDAFYELYPGANVLIAEKHEFKKENREKLFAKIATGNWDAVVVAHSSFKKIGMPEEMLNEILNEQIDDLTDSILKVKQDRGDRLTIKEMEKARDRMKAKLEKQSETGSKDRAVNFADLGVDALAVDEMHEFKNLFINTSMNRVSGLGNLAGSDKAFDMFVKVRYVQKMNEGRGVFGATGTPISNTIAELYTVQRYMHYDEMKQRGIVHFDSWASTFGQVVTGWELDATGVNYRLNSRFSKFQNVPELINMYRTFADTITQTDLQAQAAAQGRRFPVPKVKGGKPQNIIIDRTEVQADYMGVQTPVLDSQGKPATRADGSTITQWNEGSIIHRMENLPDDPRIDNPLKITNDARKAGLDFRLIDPNAPDFEGTKVNEAVTRIFAKWQEWDERGGTQLVFCDLSTPKAKRGAVEAPVQVDENDDGPEAPDEELSISMDEMLAGNGKFSVYDDMRAKLIKRGIPEDQIAFIHDYNTDARKQKLFAEMNAGTKRILFGSTAKMGAGTNVQRRLVALHHLDAPWRPSDLEQREGRILRQGNMFYESDPEGFEVEVCRYSTKQTYDARMWQTIQGKAEGIEQFRRGDTLQRVIEDVASEAANAAEMKAAATGNPLIFLQVQLSSDLKKMEAVYSGYKRAKHSTESRVDWLSRADQRADRAIERARMEIALRDRNTKDDFEFHTNGSVYGKDDQEALLAVIYDSMKSALTDAKEGVDRPTLVGVYRGFEINVFANVKTLHFTLQGNETHKPLNLVYSERDEFKLSGFFTRIDNTLDRLEERIVDAEEDRVSQKSECDRAKVEAAKPFAQMAKLEMLRKDMGDVMAELKKAQADASYVSTWEPLSYADAATQEKALAGIEATHGKAGDVDSPIIVGQQPSALEVALAREAGGTDLFGQVARTMPATDDDARKRAAQVVADYLVALNHPEKGATILGSRSHDNLWEQGDGDAIHQLVLDRIAVDPSLAQSIAQYPGSRFASPLMKEASEVSLAQFNEVKELADSMTMRVDVAERTAGSYDGQIVGVTDRFYVQKVSEDLLIAHARKDFASERDVRMSSPIQVKYTHGIALVKAQNRSMSR
ncbi:DEAD/DEAH box helicase family protein [Paraburkholderia sp. A1RI-2L]|uniref:KfrB domain-containing protein n=1 Tax=Paraburkholderia sp. A1RI-2L TaxID=3028367 RepID=UPI003B8074A4